MEMMLLEDCCDILDSMRVPITAKDRKKGSYPYYGANGIQDYVADYIFDDELVLLAEDGGNFGSEERPIAYRVSGKCWVNNHAHVLKPKAGMDVDYLCYSLMFYKVEGMVNGATRMKLTQAAMRKMLIPSRKIDEQKMIVKILNKVQMLIEVEKEQIKACDNLCKIRFVEMFGDPVRNSFQWKTKRLEDVCEGIGDGLHGTPEYAENGEYAFVNGNNLREGIIEVTSATKMVNEDVYNKYFINITDNAVLISINGTLGKVAFYNGEKIVLGKSACYCNLKSDIKREFVYHVMKSDAFIEYMENNSTKSTIKNVGLKTMRNFLIIMPPMELQDEFTLFIQQVEKLKVVAQNQLKKTQLLFNSLMQKYFG